ncbi:MAG: acyl carrier protein [marine bacterium B5-7]|nr:MAG: acyl carrier protein [marine bacterium B5-7]
MSQEEYFQELRQILVDMFELDPDQIHPETDLYADLDIDSIDAIDLLASLREKTGKRLSPEKFREVRTVNDIVDKMTELLGS